LYQQKTDGIGFASHPSILEYMTTHINEYHH